MKARTSLIVAALLASVAFGCSKHSPPPAKIADLGVVEVSNGATNRIVATGGRVFVVTSVILTNQEVTINGQKTILKGQKIALMISTEQTDSHGVTRLSPPQNVMASPGQTVGLSDTATGLGFRITPKIKP